MWNMWNELDEVVALAIAEIQKAARDDEDFEKAVDASKLGEMRNVIKLMIDANTEDKQELKASKTETAFVALHNLNTSIGGFGNKDSKHLEIVEKAAENRSQELAKKHPILKPIQPLLEKLIAFFYKLQLAILVPKARKSHTMFQEKLEKAEAAATEIQKKESGAAVQIQKMARRRRPAAAVTRIQKNYRGYKVRKGLRKASDSVYEAEALTRPAAAVTRIQKNYRGYKVRKGLRKASDSVYEAEALTRPSQSVQTRVREVFVSVPKKLTRLSSATKKLAREAIDTVAQARPITNAPTMGELANAATAVGIAAGAVLVAFTSSAYGPRQ